MKCWPWAIKTFSANALIDWRNFKRLASRWSSFRTVWSKYDAYVVARSGLITARYKQMAILKKWRGCTLTPRQAARSLGMPPNLVSLHTNGGDHFRRRLSK